jgi:hypothetical protein
MAALGGTEVGRIERDGEGYRWTCKCGEDGSASTNHQASLGLYFHRRGHAARP